MEITFDREAKRPTHGFKFTDAHGAELWASEAEVTEAEGDVRIVGKDFRPNLNSDFGRRVNMA